MVRRVREKLAALDCSNAEAGGKEVAPTAANNATGEQRRLVGKQPCGIFLMTNCRDEESLAQLREQLPGLVMYEPPNSEPSFTEEGRRLVCLRSFRLCCIRLTVFVRLALVRPLPALVNILGRCLYDRFVSGGRSSSKQSRRALMNLLRHPVQLSRSTLKSSACRSGTSQLGRRRRL